MTAEKYVKEVGKLLKCRTSGKKEIKKQLLADINSAVDNGESLEEVLGRMGIPWDYANRFNDRFDRAERKAAKRERAWKIGGILLLAAALFITVLYWKLPKFSDISTSTVFDGEQVKARTEEIIRLYSDDDFEAVVECMNHDMRQALNASALQYAKSQVKEDFGELLAFGTMYASEARQDGRTYAMVQVSVSYTDVSAYYTITFDENLELAGFYIK